MKSRRWIRWLPWLLVAGLLTYGALRYHFVGPGDPQWRPPPKPQAALRVATWNLENFPRPQQDLDRLRSEIEDLGPDLLAVQEVRDASALVALLPGWEVHLSHGGGRGHQRLGLALNPDRLELVEPLSEDDRLSLGGRVRPAVVAHLRSRKDATAFVVVVVHLKAKPDGFDDRRRQWAWLQAIAQQWSDGGARPVVLMGDFNATGPRRGSPMDERQQLAQALKPAAVRWIPVVGGCTAYWQGVRHDAWLEPSLLDMIWVSDDVGVSNSFAGGACARHACRPLRSTAAYPDPDAERASDHCPVWVDIQQLR